MTPTYIGLDMSIASTGVAIITEGEIELHTIKTRKQDFRYPIERMNHIIAKVRNYVTAECKVCIEKAFTSTKNFSGQEILSALAFNVRGMLDQKGVSYIDVAPVQLKKYATGKGNTKGKELVMKAIWGLWDIDTTDDNQAYAAVLAKIAQALDRENTTPLKQYQADVLNAIVAPKKTTKKKRRPK